MLPALETLFRLFWAIPYDKKPLPQAQRGRWGRFIQRYLDELRTDKQKIQLVTELCQLATEKKLTLLYGAKDPINNHAVVLKEEMDRKLNNIKFES